MVNYNIPSSDRPKGDDGNIGKLAKTIEVRVAQVMSATGKAWEDVISSVEVEVFRDIDPETQQAAREEYLRGRARTYRTYKEQYIPRCLKKIEQGTTIGAILEEAQKLVPIEIKKDVLEELAMVYIMEKLGRFKVGDILSIETLKLRLAQLPMIIKDLPAVFQETTKDVCERRLSIQRGNPAVRKRG